MGLEGQAHSERFRSPTPETPVLLQENRKSQENNVLNNTLETSCGLLDPTTLAEVQPYCTAQCAKRSWTREDVILQACVIDITVFPEVRIRM